jgi:hypothetical protein
MLTLLARGGLPGLRVGLEHARGALLDGGETRGLACCDAGRSRLASAVAVAGAAVPPSRSCQVPAPSAPRRRHSTAACEPSSAVRRSRPRPARCAAARPARAQLVDAGRSWAWRLQRSPRHRAGAALAGQRVVRNSQQATEHRRRGATMARYCCWWRRRVPGDMSRRRLKERDFPPGRCSVTRVCQCSGSSCVTQPERRYPAGPERQHSVVEGGCCGVGMSDRRGRGLVGSRPWPRRYSATATRSAGSSAAAP